MHTPPTPPAPAPDPGPAKKGMSTGAKVAIGCAALAVVVVVGAFAVLGAGAWFFARKAQELTEGVEAQQRATETIQNLERRYTFSPPADRIVTEDAAVRFFAVTDAAWAGLEDWVLDMERRGQRISADGLTGLRDVLAGLGGLARARLVLADALESNRMAASEYVWTGLALALAYDDLERPDARAVAPEENRALARRYRARLEEIAGHDRDAPDRRGIVFALAVMWGAVDGAFHIAEWDTLPPWLR